MELANILKVSEKTISKWESKRGLPDICLLEPLSKALNISLIELFKGKVITNTNICSNLKRISFYVCPICGNVNLSIGNNIHYCCGTELIKEESEEIYDLSINTYENEILVSPESPMTKTDYISFIAYITNDKIQFVKLYPEQDNSARFEYLGKGVIYYYNNRNGLYIYNMSHK